MRLVSRALLALPLVVMGGIAAPATSSAAPQSVIKSTYDELSCVFGTAEGDLIFFQAGAGSDGSGSGAFVEDSEGAIVLFGEGGTAAFDEDFAADVTLYDGPDSAVGDLSVRLRLTTPFEPFVDQLDESDGNVKTTGTVTTTEFAVEIGSVTFPGYTIQTTAEDCNGSRIAFDVRSNNPNRHVMSYTDFGSDRCALDGIPDGVVGLTGNTIDAPDFRVIIDDGVNPLIARGELSTSGGAKTRRGTATVPLVEIFTDEQVADLTVSLTLTRIGQQSSQRFAEGDLTEFIRWTPYDAHIEVSTSDGRSGRVHCDATSLQLSLKFRRG